MIASIIRAALGHSFVVIVLVLAAAVTGGVAFQHLRRDVFPDLSAPLFNVIVQNPAMGAEELEIAVAIPMEAALAGLPGTRRIRSTNQQGVSQITIEFEPDTEYYRARQLVSERVTQVAPTLPIGTEPPLLSSLTGRLNEIMELTLSAEAGVADLMTLRDYAELEVKNRLLAVPGVAAVERLGGYLRQVQVELDPDRMIARGVTLGEVLHALEGANVNASGGFITQGSVELHVRGIGRIDTLADLSGTVVAVRGSTPVLLGDVADVRDGPTVRRGIAHRLAGEVVSCRVVKQFGADTVAVAERVHVALEDIRSGLPRGVSLHVAYDQADLVRASLSGVERAVLLGVVLVVVVLFVLLGDLRAAGLVTITIPLSIAIAGLFLDVADIGLNTMTLGGLAVAVGLLVDASIIVVEAVLHGISDDRTRPRRTVAGEAAVLVGRPIAFSTLIVIAAFVPLLGITGIEGKMYGPLAAAVVASVTASLVLALTLTPVVSAWILRPRPEHVPDEVWIVRGIKRGYTPLLAVCMRHAWIVRVVALAITIPAIVLGTRIGRDFMPELDEGALLIETRLPPEAALGEVDRINHRIEDVLRRFPEVADVVRRTGRSERTEDPMAHTNSDILVVLQRDRERSTDALVQAMREALDDVPAASVMFTTPLGMRIDEGLGGTPADLSIRVFGPDLEVLASLAERVQAIAADVRGIEDLRVEPTVGLPELRITVDRPALARIGLTPGDVIRAIRIGLVGEVMSEVIRGGRRFDLLVRLQGDRRADAKAIRSLWLEAHDGTPVPLSQVANIELTSGPAAIRREAGSRRIAVEASVAGRDLVGTAAELRERLAVLDLPTGYFVDLGGRVEQQARAERALVLAIGVAVVAVFVLLYLALGSLGDTFVILVTLPDACVGGIAALWLAGETWNVSSLVGLIGLLGIAVQNGLVLVTQTRALVQGGKPFGEALHEACIGRVRPKLMTAATAILGLLPLLVLDLHGTEIERPLAVVMVGGLVTSTVFTLLALPTFYALVASLRGTSSMTRR